MSTYNVEPSTCREEEKRFVELAVVEKKLVVVALVEVELVAVNLWRVEEPTTRRSPDVLMVVVPEPPIERELPVKRFEKRLVEVAEVVVERLAKKPPVKVDEAVERKPLKNPRVVEVDTPQEVGVNGNTSVELQPIQEPTVSVPMFPVVANKLVELAVVEKKLVVVALVVVELEAVKFVRVDDAVERKPERKPRVVEVELPHEVGVQAKSLPLPPVGQEVWQVSPEKQIVSKVALTKLPSFVS